VLYNISTFIDNAHKNVSILHSILDFSALGGIEGIAAAIEEAERYFFTKTTTIRK